MLSKALLRIRRELIARQAAIQARVATGATVRPSEAWLASVPVRDTGADRATAYRFRHTAASSLLMAGVDMLTVAELLGTSPEILFRHYGHVLDGHLTAAAEHTIIGRRSKATPQAAGAAPSADSARATPVHPTPAGPRRSGPAPARSPRTGPR